MPITPAMPKALREEPRLAEFDVPVVDGLDEEPELVPVDLTDDVVLIDEVDEPVEPPDEDTVLPLGVVLLPPVAGVEPEDAPESVLAPPSATTLFTQEELLLLWMVTCDVKTWFPVLSLNAAVIEVSAAISAIHV